MTTRTFFGRLLIGLPVIIDFALDSLIDLVKFLEDAGEGIKESLVDLGFEVTEVPFDD